MFVYSLPCEIDRISVDNWFFQIMFIFVLTFHSQDFPWFLNDLCSFWDNFFFFFFFFKVLFYFIFLTSFLQVNYRF